MVILFRKDYSTEEEYNIAKNYCDVVEQRTSCEDTLVIGRYSVLPFYKELEIDLRQRGCNLINTYAQHSWIADFQYYGVLKDYTPETWFDHNLYLTSYEGPFVVKGQTNSKKHQWDTMMYAENKTEALEVARKLKVDGLISDQEILYRKYIPLKTYEYGLNGLPFTEEYRYFFVRDTMLASGYYWSIAEDSDKVVPEEANLFAYKIAGIVQQYVNFFVVDIARTQSGEWILIELNDAQMSGLSTINPNVLYKNLKENEHH